MSQLHPEFTGVSFTVFIFQVIHITGRLRLRVSLSHGRTVPSQIMGLVVVAHALPPPTINEVRIDCHMFVTRVNMDLNIIYCENRYSFQLLFFFALAACILYSIGLVKSFEICDSCNVILVLYESTGFTLTVITFSTLHSQRIKNNLKP